MILFYCLLMALAICYWATLVDVKHRRLHSYAFVVLLVATGWERWQAEQIDAQMMTAEETGGELLLARYNKFYEEGRKQWTLARSNLKHGKQQSQLLTQRQQQ